MGNKTGKNRSRWWFKPLAVLLSIAFGALVGEVVLRWRGVDVPTATVLGLFFQHDPTSGWVGRPHAKSRFQTRHFSVEVHHDGDGLRVSGNDTGLEADRVVSGDAAESPAGTARVEREVRTCWVMGDSNVWGWGVPNDAHFTALLNSQCRGKMQFRNLGVPGYSTVQQYYRLKDLIERGYRPDVVIVCFNNVNDILDNVNMIENDPPRPSYEVKGSTYRLVGPPMSRSWNYEVGSFLRRNSELVGFISYHAARAKYALRNSSPEASLPVQSPKAQAEDAKAPTEDSKISLPTVCLQSIVMLLQEECRKAGIEFSMVSDMPADKRLISVCSRLNVPLVDVGKYVDRLREDTGNDDVPLRFPIDYHPNEAGHELIAKAIRQELHAWHPEWRLMRSRVELAREPESTLQR